MQVDQYYRQIMPAGTAGNVIAGPSNSYAELENLGNTLTQTGIASEQQRLKAQYYDQINNARLQIAKKFEKFQNGLDPNNTDKWLDDLDGMQESYGEIKLSNEKASADFSSILEEEKFNQRKSVTDYRRVIDARNFQRNYYATYKDSMESASRAPTAGEYNQSVLTSLKSLFGLRLREGAAEITPANLETVEDFDNPLFETEKLRRNEAAAWLRDAGVMYRTEQLKNYLNTALTLEDKGLEYINSLELNATEKAELTKRYESLSSIADAKNKAQQNAAKNAIFERARNRQFEADPAKGLEDIYAQISKTITDADEQRIWGNWALEREKDWGKAGTSDKDDPKSLFEAGQIVNKVEKDELTEKEAFDELMKIAPGLKDTSLAAKINELNNAADPDAAIKKEPAAGFIKSFDKLVFDEAAKSNDGMIYYTKGMEFLRNFARENPNATPEQWVKAYSQIADPFLADWTFFFFRREWGDVMEGAFGKPKPATGKKTSKKETGEMLLDVEPQDYDGFKFEVNRINNFDPKLARRYYDKWISKWQ